MLKQLSYIAPVAAVDKNEKYFNTRRSGKKVKDFNSFGRVGRKRKPRTQKRKAQFNTITRIKLATIMEYTVKIHKVMVNTLKMNYLHFLTGSSQTARVKVVWISSVPDNRPFQGL